MKIRNGFVSNSSSSSFIVAFPKRVDEMTVDELESMLFDDEKELEHYEEKYPTSDVANQVYADATRKAPIPNTKLFSENTELLDIVISGWYDGKPEMPDKVYKLKGDEKAYWDIYYEIDKATAKQRLQDFIMSSFMSMETQPVYYVFSYSDNDGEFMSMMEHGDIFDNLPHMTISHH